MALSDLRRAVEALIRDDASAIDDDEYADAIVAAVAQYSRDRPRSLVEDLVMAGGALALPQGWDAEASVLAAIEHPLGERPPAWHALAHWTLYREPERTVIRALGACPPPDGDTVRCTYTAPHVLDAQTDTVPGADREAVAAWAAALALEQLAARAAATTDSTIAADSVEPASRAPDYRALARGHRDRYWVLMGRGKTGRDIRPAGASAHPAGRRRRFYDLWRR